MLWNVRQLGLTGSKVETVLDLAGITTNKNSIPGDTSALNPGGVRVGTPALTSRGLDSTDFDVVAGFLHRGAEIAMQAQDAARLKAEQACDEQNTPVKVLLKDFKAILQSDETIKMAIEELRLEVEDFSTRFPMPGIEVS